MSNSRMTRAAALVLAETAFFTGAGMEAAMKGRDYALNDEARKYWLEKHANSIPKALKRPNAKWDIDRTRVNPRARDLGTFAAQFALDDAPSTGVVEVTKTHVQKASKKVNDDPRCQAAKNKPGGGEYCEGG